MFKSLILCDVQASSYHLQGIQASAQVTLRQCKISLAHSRPCSVPAP